MLDNFSETLSELILMHNLDASKLGKQISIDRSTITKYLSKRSYPELSYAIKIADYFGCSSDYLFGLTNDYKKKTYLPCPPFYQSFQELLKSRKCTRYRLCKDMEFYDQVVDDWYNNKHIPTMDKLIKIADYFGCTLDELVGRKSVD